LVQTSFGLDSIRNHMMALDGKRAITNDHGESIKAVFSAVT